MKTPIYKILQSTVLLFISLILIQCGNKHDVIFPEPFSIVVDDMGWMEGSDLSDKNGPYRLGFDRILERRDYRPFIAIGEKLGIRFQGSFIISEFDKENILANYPGTTEFGTKWDNSSRNIDSLNGIMDYIKKNAAYLEFGIHGIRHEFWDNGIAKRAEWYDMFGGKPWQDSDITNHINCFKAIMNQYGINKENGQSFPESFVPTAYAFYWNPEEDNSTAAFMSKMGVKYANTDMRFIEHQNPPMLKGGGIDHGVHFLHRRQYGNDWNEIAKLPDANFERFETDPIEAHWTNFLSEKTSEQDSLNNAWILYLKRIQKSKSHYLAKNTEQLHSQWFYKKYSKITQLKGSVAIIDNTNMPKEVYQQGLLGNMVLAIRLKPGEHLSKGIINDEPIAAYFESSGYAYIYLPVLERKVYTFEYTVDDHQMRTFVNNTGTYNIYNFSNSGDKISINLRMYGTQEVNIKCFQPDTVFTDNPHLQILDQSYDSKTGFLTLKVYGRDMQGEKGILRIERFQISD
ncbi:hypothetical protein ACFLRY_00165 [Bacteroidota bacterium]